MAPRPSRIPLPLAGLLALAVAMGIGRFAFTPVLPMMQADLGLSLAQGSWLASANYLGYLLGALLVTVFIWVAENVGTFAAVWRYPDQREAWTLVGFGKFGSWYLLMLLSYVLVSLVNQPKLFAPEPDGVPRASA